MTYSQVVIATGVALAYGLLCFKLGALSERIDPESVAPPGMVACSIPLPNFEVLHGQ